MIFYYADSPKFVIHHWTFFIPKSFDIRQYSVLDLVPIKGLHPGLNQLIGAVF